MLSRPVRILFASAIFWGISISNSYCQTTNWKLRKNKSGIQVYTRSVENFNIDEFKGETTLNVPIERIVKALENIEGMKEWIPDCKVVELMEIKGNDQYHYIETSVPFPLSNRDAVYLYQYKDIEEGVRVEFRALPEYIPEKKGIVRIPFVEGFWILKRKSENTTFVHYQVLAKPGGAVPDWLANTSVVDTPFKTLRNLREYLE